MNYKTVQNGDKMRTRQEQERGWQTAHSPWQDLQPHQHTKRHV